MSIEEPHCLDCHRIAHLCTCRDPHFTPRTMVETFEEVMSTFPMNSMHQEVYDIAIEVMNGRTKKWNRIDAEREFRKKNKK